MANLGATEPLVWLSRSDVSSQLLFGFQSQLFENDPHALVARLRLFKRGGAISADDLPSEMWIAKQYRSDDRRNLPNFLSAGGFLVVSEAVAAVLEQFELGETRLHPVKLLKSNRKDTFPGRHFLLNIAEVRRHFSLKHSVRVKPLPEHGSYLASPLLTIEDGDIAVNSNALLGPDLWMDDTILTHFFCSDRLVSALRAAKLTSRLPLYRCHVHKAA